MNKTHRIQSIRLLTDVRVSLSQLGVLALRRLQHRLLFEAIVDELWKRCQLIKGEPRHGVKAGRTVLASSLSAASSAAIRSRSCSSISISSAEPDASFAVIGEGVRGLVAAASIAAA